MEGMPIVCMFSWPNQVVIMCCSHVVHSASNVDVLPTQLVMVRTLCVHPVSALSDANTDCLVAVTPGQCNYPPAFLVFSCYSLSSHLHDQLVALSWHRVSSVITTKTCGLSCLPHTQLLVCGVVLGRSFLLEAILTTWSATISCFRSKGMLMGISSVYLFLKGFWGAHLACHHWPRALLPLFYVQLDYLTPRYKSSFVILSVPEFDKSTLHLPFNSSPCSHGSMSDLQFHMGCLPSIYRELSPAPVVRPSCHTFIPCSAAQRGLTGLLIQSIINQAYAIKCP